MWGVGLGFRESPKFSIVWAPIISGVLVAPPVFI